MVPPLVIDAEFSEQVRRIVIEPDMPVVIGRTAGADIVIKHGTMARRHAWIRHDTGFWTVEDAGSPCGTMVNYEFTSFNRIQLCLGDRVNLGQVVLIVRDGAPPPEAGRVVAKLERSPYEPPPPTGLRGTFWIRDGVNYSAADRWIEELLDAFDDESEDGRALVEVLRRARRAGTADLRGLDRAAFQRLLAEVEGVCLHHIIYNIGVLRGSDHNADLSALGELLMMLRTDDRARERPLPALSDWQRSGLLRVMADQTRPAPLLLRVLAIDRAWAEHAGVVVAATMKQ